MSLPWSIEIETIFITGGVGGTCLLMEPHGSSSRPQPLLQRGGVVEAPNGARVTDKTPATAQARHEFEFICENPAQRAFLVDFFETHRGMAAPFWFPTWQWEFDVCGYSLELFTGSLWVKRWLDKSYADDFFAASRGFRKLIMLYDDQYKVHTVASVTASDSPGVDVLHIENNGTGLAIAEMGDGPNQHNERWRPLWLRWGRFDQDELDEEALNLADGICRIRLAMLELPDEVPTP